MKKTLLIMLLTAGIGQVKAQVFQETFGTATANAKIEDYKGFSNVAVTQRYKVKVLRLVNILMHLVVPTFVLQTWPKPILL
jgi:hypothetical protein